MLNVLGLHVHQEFMYESISIDQTLSQYVHMCVCIIYSIVNVFLTQNVRLVIVYTLVNQIKTIRHSIIIVKME